MSYQLKVHEKSGYLHIIVEGENSVETVRNYLANVASVCADRKCPYVLIEENLKGPGLAIADIYQIVAEGSVRAIPHMKQVAYVDVNDEHSKPDMQFAETVAVNRGLNIRVFGSLFNAEQWLRGEVNGLQGPPYQPGMSR